MPPLDWGRIMGANVEELREDLNAADEMYGVLEMVNLTDFHLYYLFHTKVTHLRKMLNLYWFSTL